LPLAEAELTRVGEILPGGAFEGRYPAAMMPQRLRTLEYIAVDRQTVRIAPSSRAGAVILADVDDPQRPAG
jgi:hypothetical protein